MERKKHLRLWVTPVPAEGGYGNRVGFILISVFTLSTFCECSFSGLKSLQQDDSLLFFINMLQIEIISS